MNLLMFNLAVDAEHVTLAFGLRWIEKLAGEYDHVDVVTMSAGQYALPSNVTVWSLGRERGYAEWVRVIRFYWIVWQILRKRRIAVVFTHMIPVFAVLFWPVARLSGLRNVLWYAHGATPKMLKLAHLVVDKVVSSTPQGFRLPSTKACFIGQGIDTGVYQFHPRQPRQVFHIVTVGRISPSKNLELLVRSLANWQAEAARNWHLTIVGDGTMDEERGYAARLRQQVNNMLGQGKVTFTGRLNAEQVSSVLAEADLFISLGATGSLDKAIVEAMVSGCPVVSSNDAFRAIAHQSGFSCAVIEPTVGEVCAALSRFAAMAPDDIQALANKQAAVAARDHTLDGLTQRMARILAGMAR